MYGQIPASYGSTVELLNLSYWLLKMAEYLNSKPLVYVTPIWRRKKRIKSFKQAALIVLEFVRLSADAKQKRLQVEIMVQKMRKLKDEDESKAERLRKVQSLAKLKKPDYENNELEESKQQYLKMYKERCRYFALVEKMDKYSETRWKKQSENGAVSRFETFKHQFGLENKRQGSPASVMKLKATEEKKGRQSTDTRNLLEECVVGRSEKANKKIIVNLGKGQNWREHKISATPAKGTGSELQVSVRDVTRDSRFQSLLRSLTPIGPQQFYAIKGARDPASTMTAKSLTNHYGVVET